MARYNVYNPEGEETPADRQARDWMLRSVLAAQMGSGAPGSTSTARGPMMGGGMGEEPADPVADIQQRVQAERDLIRERAHAQMALDAQQGNNRLDITGLEQGGMNTRQGMAMGPANSDARIRRDAFGIERGKREADARLAEMIANSKADQLGKFLGKGQGAPAGTPGVGYESLVGGGSAPAVQSQPASPDYSSLVGGGTQGAPVIGGQTPGQSPGFMEGMSDGDRRLFVGLMGLDPSTAVDPSKEMDKALKLKIEEAYFQAKGAAGLPDIQRARASGNYAALQLPNRIDKPRMEEAAAAAQLPEVQAAKKGVTEYIASVSGWWSDANKQLLLDRMKRIEMALAQAGATPEATKMVVDGFRNEISDAMDAEGWDANGADEVRKVLGIAARNGTDQSDVNEWLGYRTWDSPKFDPGANYRQ